MKKNIKDIFDSYSDEAVDIKACGEVLPKKIIEMTKNKIKEDNIYMQNYKAKRKMHIAIIAAAAVIMLSVSVFAAYRLLSPKEAAIVLQDYKLSQYFSDSDTKFDFRPQVSRKFTIQLLGIASGKNISEFADADDDKSYVVGAISKSSGEKLTDYTDIMISPLVSGYNPWTVNIFTIGGGGKSSFLYDGVEYFIIECDNINIFADHTVYVAAYEGMAPSAEIFVMDDKGNIDFNENYKGVKAMFVLPLDKSKADPEAVKRLLEQNGGDESGVNETNEEAHLTADDFEINETKTDDAVLIEINEKL